MNLKVSMELREGNLGIPPPLIESLWVYKKSQSGDVVQWWSVWPEGIKPWVQYPNPQRKKGEGRGGREGEAKIGLPVAMNS